jgi:hypothetical protein
LPQKFLGLESSKEPLTDNLVSQIAFLKSENRTFTKAADTSFALPNRPKE